MLSDTLPTLKDRKYPDSIKLKDGDTVEGVILGGEMISTQFGEAYKFTFEVNGTQKGFITKSEFLASKLNEAQKGDLVTIHRDGEGTKTRWIVTIA